MVDTKKIKDATEVFASFTDSAIKLKNAELLNEDGSAKLKETVSSVLEKFQTAVKDWDFTQATQAEPEKKEEAPAAQSTSTVTQPVLTAPTAAVETPPVAQKLFMGYTELQLKQQNVTVLRDVAISLQGRPNTNKNVPQGGGMMEQVFKDQLIVYIMDNAHLA